MHISRALRVALAGALLTACGALAGPDFPAFAETSYRIEGVMAVRDGRPPTRAVIYRDGRQMRVETTIPHYGPAVVVFDRETGAPYVLTTAAALGAPTPEGDVETLSGYAVRLDEADAPQPMETYWAALGEENARSLGRCEVAGERGREWTPRVRQEDEIERVACIARDGIVLRVREDGMTIWEATALARGPQPPSLFGVPPGYRRLESAALSDDAAPT